METKTSDRSYNPDRARFLFPLTIPNVRSEADPLVTRLMSSIARTVRCPLPPSKGGLSPVDDVAARLPANLRVMFSLQRIENEVVANGGVTVQCWAMTETHSAIASEQDGGPFFTPAPGAGEIWPIRHGLILYDALVLDGCGNTPVFPVEFSSSVGEQADILDEYVEIGDFQAVDDDTLKPNGFWTFAYTIRATGTKAGVSDFKFNGVVSVTCTNIVTL